MKALKRGLSLFSAMLVAVTCLSVNASALMPGDVPATASKYWNLHFTPSAPSSANVIECGSRFQAYYNNKCKAVCTTYNYSCNTETCVEMNIYLASNYIDYHTFGSIPDEGFTFINSNIFTAGERYIALSDIYPLSYPNNGNLNTYFGSNGYYK